MIKQVKTIIFARVSSREQEDTGYSLDSQVKLLQGYADERNFKVFKIFKVSESASGKQVRKMFNEMLDYATKNNIPVILCEKIDRLTRNPKDAGIVDDWIKEDNSREIHFVKESFILNNKTKAHESLVWDMKVAIARFYTNNLSEEVQKGQREKIAQGWLPTKPPLGYKTIGEKGHKIHVIDEVVAPLVKKMFEMYSTGNYSTKTLGGIMYKEGLRTRLGGRLVKSRTHELLSDPFYCGKLRWKGKIYKGQQEPLISEELFNIVQAKLTRKTAYPLYRKHLPVFKAKMKCGECGGTVTWETQKGHWYGHCSHYRECSQRKYIRQEKVEEQLFPYFDKVAPLSDDVLRELEAELKKSQVGEIDYNTSKKKELTEIIRVTDRRIERAYRDKLDGRMPTDLCAKIMDESTKEKEEAVKELEKLGKDRTLYYQAGFAIHELALKAKEIYSSPKTTAEDKRLLLSYTFSNLGLKGDTITPNYTLAFEFLLDWMPRINAVYQTKNPVKNGVSSKTLGHPYGTAQSPFTNDIVVTTSGLSADKSLEPRNNFRTSKNLYPKQRFGVSSAKSQLLLPG